MDWNEFWDTLLSDRKIKSKVNQINEADMLLYGEERIEKICHCIYDEYGTLEHNLNEIKRHLLVDIENFAGVHLLTSRVKKVGSLLCKVIIKKHAHMFDESNPYHDIDENNYNDIITDLIGIRLIISYKGKWVDLHKQIIEKFPYAEDSEYKNHKFIPHPEDGRAILAEIPKVYYAYGDDLSIYNGAKVDLNVKENGYRSAHYVVSYEKTYIEIQTRTIYDEAWSDCDHNYVYKRETHESYSALNDLSQILNLLTNASNDLVEKMQIIFENKMLKEHNGKYQITSRDILKMSEISDKIGNAYKLLDDFNEKIVESRGESHE